MSVLRTLQQHVGGCRESLGPPAYDLCWKPAEYILWGKLLPADALGPRCYKHAAVHVGGRALDSRSNFALVNLADLARDLTDAQSQGPTTGGAT